MKKTFCDRCGTECISLIAHVHLGVEHFRPSNRELVAEDEFGPVELCSGCKESLRDWFRELGMKWPSLVRPKEMALADEPAYLLEVTAEDTVGAHE